MNSVRTFRALIVVTCGSAAAALLGWVLPGPTTSQLSPSRDGVVYDAPESPVISADVIDSLATVIRDHDPFRLTREPSTVAYIPSLDGAPPPPPLPPKPTLVLSGIIGPPWVAVLDGVPAHEGSLLAKVGDTVSHAPFALVTVRAIRHDTVVVHSADTTWTLTVRHVWR
jgi:hypothetical protein